MLGGTLNYHSQKIMETIDIFPLHGRKILEKFWYLVRTDRAVLRAVNWVRKTSENRKMKLIIHIRKTQKIFCVYTATFIAQINAALLYYYYYFLEFSIYVHPL